MATDYGDWFGASPTFIMLHGDDDTPQRLRSIDGALYVASSIPLAENVDSGAGSVNVLTPLFVWRPLGDDYDRLVFTVFNDSASENVNVTVEFSDDGNLPDVSTFQVVATPQTQASVEVSAAVMHRYWRMSVNTDAPYGTAAIRWLVQGTAR